MKKCKHLGCDIVLTAQDIEDYIDLCYSHGEDAIDAAEEKRLKKIAERNEY